MSLQYQEGQEYFWLSNQSPEEVILFTSWDSFQSTHIASESILKLYPTKLRIKLGHTPHGAFIDTRPSDLESRESVEVRLIVMWSLE